MLSFYKINKFQNYSHQQVSTRVFFQLPPFLEGSWHQGGMETLRVRVPYDPCLPMRAATTVGKRKPFDKQHGWLLFIFNQLICSPGPFNSYNRKILNLFPIHL